MDGFVTATDPIFLAAVAIAALGALAALVSLWRYSGKPEQSAGPWDRPPNVKQPLPVPPGFRLVLQTAASDWSDQQAWTELVARLDDVATSLQAGPPSTAAPTMPSEDWFTTELSRLEGHLSATRSAGALGDVASDLTKGLVP